jgi:hypothetical protein
MSPLAADQKRNRRLYTRSGDFPILSQVAKHQFVTVEMVAEDLQRNIISVRRRMLALYQAGILNRARRDKLAPFVYFLSEKGSAIAVGHGSLFEPRWIKSKSSLLIPHDLEITMFHRALEKGLHNEGHFIGQWEQWRGALRQEVETNKGVESLIPDGQFVIDDRAAFYLEIVKSYESEYENGESNIEHKIFLYNEYWKASREPFHVCFVMPTKPRVAHFLSKIEERFPYRRFWFTDEESYHAKVTGGIWWTPRDFRDTTHSLLDQMTYD